MDSGLSKTGNHCLSAGCMCCFDPVVVCENPLEESGVYDVLPKCDIFVIMWDIMGHKSEELHLPRRLAQNQVSDEE